MAADALPRHWLLAEHLIEDIKHGNIALPDIQTTVCVVGGQGPGSLRLDVPGLPGRHVDVLGDRG